MLFFIIFLLILFFPIRVKFIIIYENGVLNFYVMNKNINLKEKTSERKVSSFNIPELQRKFKRIFKRDVKFVLHRLSLVKNKPKLQFKYEMEYGFKDAAATGICCGLFSAIQPVLYKLFENIFKVKSCEFVIQPHFNKPMFNFRIISIFSFNLAKIIYIIIKIYFWTGGVFIWQTIP